MTKFAVAALAAVLTFGGLSASAPAEARFSAPAVRVSPMPRISTPTPRVTTPKPVAPTPRTKTTTTTPSTSASSSNAGMWAILGSLLMMEAATLTLAEMRDFHQANQNPTAELTVFPGGKH